MLHDEFLFSPQDEDTTGDDRSFIDMSEEVAVSQALHRAATSGDISTIRLLVARGADVNAPDSAGRSVIVSLVLGDSAHNGDVDALECDILARTAPPLDMERLEALRFLLELRETTLYTLNAPQAVLHGVTPLGMTAYLNQLEAVRLLLDQSGGLVAVDGMDAHGATPLMYASRDGNADVVRCLLEHGARPDLKDVNHYSALQYATRHPLTLWLCETSLRKHRAKASQSSSGRRTLKLSIRSISNVSNLDLNQPPLLVALSPSHITQSVQSLIDAINTSNLTAVHTLLFPPSLASSSATRITESSVTTPQVPVPLVNYPDAQGWSPIHHCTTAAKPDMKILDTLFLAGADMGLYTSSDHSTPLHCLARTARESSESYSFLLYSFITHLVRDLRAPLDARDSNGETCMHIAAEHGHHIIVLMAFLDCDTNESVAKTRNSRGLTPFEVAKPEFRVAFGDDVDIRPASCASMRTIKPRISSSSVSTSDSLSTTPKTQSSMRRSHGRRSPSIDVISLPSDPSSSVQVILDTFHAIAEDLCEPISLDINLAVLEGMLQESASLGSMVLKHYRDRLDDELDELRDAQRIYGKLDTLLGMLGELVRKRIRRASRQSSSSSASLASKSSVSSFASMTLVNSSDGSGRSRSSTLSSYASLSPTPSRTTADSPVLSGITKVSPASSKVNLNQSGRKKGMWPSWLKPFSQKSSSDSPFTYLSRDVQVQPAEIDDRPPPLPEKDRSLAVSPLKKPHKLKSFSKVLRKEKLQSAPASQEMFGSQLFLPNLGCHSEESCGSSVASSICDFYVDSPSSPPSAWGRYNKRSAGDSAALQASLDLLDAARRDASRLDGLMAAVEQAIASAYGTLSDVETLMRKVLASNEHALQGAKLSRALADLQDLAESRDSLYSVRSITPDLFTFPSPPQFEHLPSHTPKTILPPSPSSFSSVHSDEEHTETLSRLLVQKLPARVDKVFDDVEKATVWLGIIRETTRTVQKQVKL